MTARGHYRNPRYFDKAHQVVVFSNPVKAYHRTVREVRILPDGKTYGWIRHDNGNWVVRLNETAANEGNPSWDVISSMSVTELHGGSLIEEKPVPVQMEKLREKIRGMKVPEGEAERRVTKASGSFEDGYNTAIDEVLELILGGL